jgi:SAM-dependent methyltransferase
MKEQDIRPKEIFDQYLELCRRDIDRFFGNRDGFAAVGCPACGGDELGDDGFEKLGFTYAECHGCGTLYVTPRPVPEMQATFARQSEATKFWSTHFYRQTADARRQKIFRPRAELVRNLVRDGVVKGTHTFADVGAGYGMFLEEVRDLGIFENVVGIEPAPLLADVCREKGFSVVEKMMEDVGESEIEADLLTAFEVVEHIFEPRDFLAACARALRPGGVFLFTTLTITGFDLQVLWHESNSIYPPQHINMISVDGMRRLVERSGLELLSLTTPGQLDVDIVANALRDRPSIDVPRFVRKLVTAPRAVQEDFQHFLQNANLSSHVRVLARKRRPA